MFIGPVFARELVTAPRRSRLFIYRSVYPTVLFGVMCTAWLILTGTQTVTSVGGMAKFGGILFQLLAPLQLAMVVFFAALSTASAVSQEKDRRTLILLLLTRLNNSELVLGKLFASLLHVGAMVLSGLPVFAFLVLFGGVSFAQVARVTAVTLATAFVAGSLGSTLALWREKTFQTLALTALVLVFGLLGVEAIRAGFFGDTILGVEVARWAVWLSPVRATLAGARPSADLAAVSWMSDDVMRYVVIAVSAALLLDLVAILRVRYWNPSREVRPQAGTVVRSQESIWGAEHDVRREQEVGRTTTEANRTGSGALPYRQVWVNPVLWREICTWAYGRKILVIRLAYLFLFLMALAGVVYSGQNAVSSYERSQQVLPPAAWPVIPFLVVSLVILTALAVTAITTERDGKSLDLLLVTDLTPREFLFGKLGGVFWVAKEMVVLPLALCVYLWWAHDLEFQNLVYVGVGLLVMDIFVAMLGVHCGMTYANSRAAIAVSLGTVFFLFLGVATCIVMMISFSGSFQVQLAPFLAFILGGGVGLYVALGIRNPSPAILLASLVLPFATFYAITSFLMDYTLAVFLVMAVAYSFTTAAMMIPALAEFDFAMGRDASGDE